MPTYSTIKKINARCREMLYYFIGHKAWLYKSTSAINNPLDYFVENSFKLKQNKPITQPSIIQLKVCHHHYH